MSTDSDEARQQRDSSVLPAHPSDASLAQNAYGVFEDALAALPPSLRFEARRRLEVRGRTAPRCTSWGSVGFDLVCDSLQVPSDKFGFLRRLWNLLYSYCIFLDDVIDAAEDYPSEIMTCDLTLDAVHFEIAKVAREEELMASFQRYRRESIASMTAELSDENVLCTLSGNATELILGRKAAMIKFFADVISYHHAGRVCTSLESGRFDALCSAVQIVDDLTDVEADASSRRTNAISVFVNRNFPGIRILTRDHKVNAIRAALVVSGRYERMLERAEQLFRKFHDTFRGCGATTDRLLLSTLEDCRQTRHAIATFRAHQVELCGLVRDALAMQGVRRRYDDDMLAAIARLSMSTRSGVRAAN
ncbi:MAG TPA: class 1 isoprenoid biosynthesis enzyme [Allosphingosinicella sp.]|nr:class 1 isoprenoid biosynthesis enzyme [Allosphingosinicella sp.]